MSRRYLITGVAGFIASTLAERILSVEPNARVLGIDAMTDYYSLEQKRCNLDRLYGANFEFVEADIMQVANLSELVEVDAIFHLAGQPGVRASWGSTFHSFAYANILTTQALLEACRTAGRQPKFVYASSSSVYGNAETYPTAETVTPQPVSPYGVTKLAGEHLCSLYGTQFGLPTISLRYFTVYGPRQRPDMAFSRFCHAAMKQAPIEIYGDGRQVRDFTFVDDVVSATFAAANADLAPGMVLNIAGGVSTDLHGILDILRRISESPLQASFKTALPGDALRTGGDISAAQRYLSWSPQVGLSDGLRRQFEWISSTRGARNAFTGE